MSHITSDNGFEEITKGTPMNDFSASNDVHTDTFFTSNDLRPNRQAWKIGGAVAAVATLIGIGAVVTVGGGTSTAASTPTAAPAITAPVIEAPTVTIAPVVAATPSATPSTTVAPAPTPAPAPAAAPTPAPAPQAAPAAQATPTAAPAASTAVCPEYFPKFETPYGLCEEGPEIAMVQTWLVYLGHDLAEDGKFGPATLAALQDVQAGNGLDVNGLITDRFLTTMSDRLFHEEPGDEGVDEHTGIGEAWSGDDEAWGQDTDVDAAWERHYDYCMDMYVGVIESTPEALADCAATFGW